jgi:hypothetical protein
MFIPSRRHIQLSVFCTCVTVAVVCFVALGFSLVTMDKYDEEVPKALLEVAKGNVHFANSLYKVRGRLFADTNVASLLYALETE